MIEEDDLQFLEKWHPLPYLTVEPNKRARDEFKKMLLQKYSRPMKAWPTPRKKPAKTAGETRLSPLQEKPG